MRYTSVKKALVKGFSLVELVIALALALSSPPVPCSYL